MREISAEKITEAVRTLCIEANYNLGEDILRAFDNAILKEESDTAREALIELKENARIAREEQMPLCQDCGLAVLFVEIGQDVHITDGNVSDAINEGVRRGYKDGYLRKSTCDPFTRKNAGDNTPAIIHYDIVSGDKIKIILAPKGGGSENMSAIAMLAPSQGISGIKNFILKRISEAGSNPCPPIIVGIGIGGNFERSAYLSKKALLREIGARNADAQIAELERELLSEINCLGIGAMGYGGRITSLDVFIEIEPCHIASLPVALNINCHSARHKEVII